MISFSLMFLIIASFVSCDDLFGMRLTTEKLKAKESTQYLFRYYVKDDMTGDYKTQEETRQGDSVSGSYTLAEPNGDLRTVTYQAGPGRGFEATVNVQPSKSPMKQSSEHTTVSTTIPTKQNIQTSEIAKTEKITTAALESNVKHFPGGFIMDILSKPQSDTKTEVGMKFSMNPNTTTQAITEPTVKKTTAIFENKTTKKSETSLPVEKPIKTLLEEFTLENIKSEIENSTFPTEGREITEDPVEKEINEAMNSMPKLPEFVLSDNVTHFKFHKDPEEALLDERITQIARQLAETSLRREYEERKLGHFIPISVRPIEPSTSGYLSKSLKFTGNDVPQFQPSETAPLQVLTQVRVVPQYIYKETLVPKFSPLHYRLPIGSKPILKTDSFQDSTYKTITNSPEKLANKSESPLKKITSILEAERSNFESPVPYSLVPIQVPTFFQFFSPMQRYMMHTQRAFGIENKPALFVSRLDQGYTTGKNPINDETTFYSNIPMENGKSTENAQK